MSCRHQEAVVSAQETVPRIPEERSAEEPARRLQEGSVSRSGNHEEPFQGEDMGEEEEEEEEEQEQEEEGGEELQEFQIPPQYPSGGGYPVFFPGHPQPVFHPHPHALFHPSHALAMAQYFAWIQQQQAQQSSPQQQPPQQQQQSQEQQKQLQSQHSSQNTFYPGGYYSGMGTPSMQHVPVAYGTPGATQEPSSSGGGGVGVTGQHFPHMMIPSHPPYFPPAGANATSAGALPFQGPPTVVGSPLSQRSAEDSSWAPRPALPNVGAVIPFYPKQHTSSAAGASTPFERTLPSSGATAAGTTRSSSLRPGSTGKSRGPRGRTDDQDRSASSSTSPRHQPHSSQHRKSGVRGSAHQKNSGPARQALQSPQEVEGEVASGAENREAKWSTFRPTFAVMTKNAGAGLEPEPQVVPPAEAVDLVVQVEFKQQRRQYFHFSSHLGNVEVGQHVICEADRGEDLGRVISVLPAVKSKGVWVASGILPPLSWCACVLCPWIFCEL